MNTQQIATHPGTVIATKAGHVTVKIQSHSACASCQAHHKCGFAESKDKTLDIPTPHWHQYQVGQHVTVQIAQSHGLFAVSIAYLLPALLLLIVAITLSLAGIKESIVILITFATLALYTLLLYLLRNKINQKFQITIKE